MYIFAIDIFVVSRIYMLPRKQRIQILVGVEIVSVTVPIFGQQAQTILIVQPKVPKFTKKLFPSLLIILSPITFSKIHRDFKPDIFPTSIFLRIVHHSAREKTP